MVAFGADRIISICRQRNMRPSSQSAPHIGEAAHAAFGGQWGDGRRLIGLLSSNAVVEKEGGIRNVPMVRVRKAVESIIDFLVNVPASADYGLKTEASSSTAGRVVANSAGSDDFSGLAQQDTFVQNPTWLSTVCRPPQHQPGCLPTFALPNPFCACLQRMLRLRIRSPRG